MVPRFSANPVECRGNEYLDDRGKCSPCKQCGPGMELSEECGYGEGSNAQCVPCQPRRFKDGWGHHGCKPCASCSLINRVQKSNCSATSDAVCGECFPGFYRKTQIGGFQDLVCVPCTKQTPPSERQCRARVSLVKVESHSAPAHASALVALTISALVIILLVLLTVSILYGRRFWKSQCQRVLQRSPTLPGQRVTFQASALPAGVSFHKPTLDPPCFGTESFMKGCGPLEGPSESVPCVPEAEVPGFHLPGYQPDLDSPALVTLSPKAPLARNPLETRPLLRNSECSDCSAGGSSFMEVGHGSGEDPGHPTPPPSFCAMDIQPRWPHAPVECTELDLQAFSDQAGRMVIRHKEDARKMVAQEQLHPEAPVCPVYPSAKGQLACASAPTSSLSFRDPIVESGEQLGGDVQSIVAEIHDVLQDLPLASLPASLVLSLADHLDPSLPGLKNFSHLGEELGVPAHKQPQISGFVELVAFLASSGRPLSVLSLAQALQKLQRFDAFLLLYGHFVGSQTHHCSH
ncbi:tumor necrosis factor receptor superfamily member 27 isoform X2 [Sceloporus undulatus]|uniref:tumor necrosis factor receptor superfamily member 27 isoform X2 n=1 Tax=Sceloporus undulatus TaxID=8520 RepID=UPI001C4C81BB|nr:tumor necrosis factor receptor superfamily member 27 isoform X2 [Sceloporus undulatus]